MLDINPSKFRANGKLLLTAEYFVLEGAVALATPLKAGQYLQVLTPTVGHTNRLVWNSMDHEGKCWFTCEVDMDNLRMRTTNDTAVANRLIAIFRAIQQLNPTFWAEVLALHKGGLTLKSFLEFPRAYGWGTSSTLIFMLAKWAGVNPQSLLSLTFGGSGYDIACAEANGPILYQKRVEGSNWVDISWSPSFVNQLYLVYLQKKQNSRTGIQRFKSKVSVTDQLIQQFTALTTAFLQANDGQTLNEIMVAHESIIAQHMELPTVKNTYFADFPGGIKSLGAWGGDFILVNSSLDPGPTNAYFKEKGFPVCLPFLNCALQKNREA